MKKLLILALAVICIFALVACGGNTDDTSSDTGKPSTDTSSDTASDTSTDTSSDTDTDTDADQNPPEDVIIPWESEADAETQEKVEALLASKHRLEYNEDGSFRVLILADLHLQLGSDGQIQALKDKIKLVVDRENPNLVIFTGDNTLWLKPEENLRQGIDIIAGYLEEKQIPWCHVYGNHDYDGGKGMTKEEQQAIYESYEYCISKNEDIFENEQYAKERVGNYAHAVYNADGSIGSVIYFMDSGEYSRYGYAYILDDQINWYKETSELLQTYNNGKVVNGLMSFHIPLLENNHAYENRENTELVYEWDGCKFEDIHSSSYDTNLFETILERGDIKGIVTGHDHLNDYCFNYKGVKLMAAPNLSEMGYTYAYTQGARVIDLNASTVGTNIPTYVSHIIDRPNPDDFGTLDANVSLEYGSEQIENAHKGNGSYGTAEGKYEVTLKDGAGVDGSEAIEVLRGNSGTFDLSVEITNKGKLGSNKYLVVWADFSQVEFLKACFGVITEHGVSVPFMTSSVKEETPFYYLADGEAEWQELKTSANGYFGAGEGESYAMNGKKGYFAIPLEYCENNSMPLTENSLIAGFYFYGANDSNLKYRNKASYFDNIMLVEDYTELFK